MIEIDFEKAKTLLRAEIDAAAEGGVTFYTNEHGSSGPEMGTCSYVHRYREDGSAWNDYDRDNIAERVPGCIVGRVLINQLNIPIEWFDGNEGGFGLYLAGKIEAGHKIKFTSEAIRLLGDVQELQDSGKTWEEAYSEAVDSHSE